MTPQQLRFNYVYPGHPIIVAICIMHAFKNASEALEPSHPDRSWPKAVSSMEVPGGGDCAGAGADVIRMLRDGKSTDEAIEFANDYWLRCVNPDGSNHPDKWESGQKEANDHIDLFKQMTEEWDLT